MGYSTVFTILIVAFSTSCARIAEPEFREVKDFRVKTLGLDQVSIGLGMQFYNPNSFSVTVKETGTNVFLDSVFLGRFAQDTVVAVGSKANFTIPLTGTIPLTTFFNLNVQDIHKRQVLIQAEGSTKVGKGGIFITKKLKYEGLHRLSEIKL